MKKAFLLLTTSLSFFLVNAQKYEDIKNLLLFNKFQQAKTDLDKAMTNAKFTAKGEAYMLKTAVYAGVALNLLNINIGMLKDEVIKKIGVPKNITKTTTSEGTSEMLFYDNYVINLDTKGKVDWINDSGNTSGIRGRSEMLPKMVQMLDEAHAAFNKYKEMEPEMLLITDPVYQNGPVNLYSGLYSTGYIDYNDKKWNDSYEKFKKAAELSDILILKKILTTSLDTNVQILAAITAENSNHKDDAAKYYSRLADNKVSGEGFESVYRYLVNYYFTKKDIPAFEKYKAMGMQLYPKSDYFKFDKIDFAVGLEKDFDAKLKAVETMLAADPDNYKANIVLGELIYDTLNSRIEGAPLPANADELELKMVTAFKKAAIAKPESENTWLYIGDNYINKAVRINAEREAHATAVKARTKPGTMASKDDIAKRDMLDKKYSDALEGAREPYEKVVAIFAAKPKNEEKGQALRDKQQYKKAASYLADIAANKKINSKGKPADIAKYTAEEKKWNDLYESIK